LSLEHPAAETRPEAKAAAVLKFRLSFLPWLGRIAGRALRTSGKGGRSGEIRRPMSKVRVLVGTHKGAFILSSDGKRKTVGSQWSTLCGLGVVPPEGLTGGPQPALRLANSGWFGQTIQRSDDGGANWTPAGNKFTYEGVTGTHQWYDGTPHPWSSSGMAPGALAHRSRRSLRGCRGRGAVSLHRCRRHLGGTGRPALPWNRFALQPGAGGMGLHTIILDPSNPQRIYIAISAAGAFRTDDGGKSWKPINKGLVSPFMPNPTAEVGHCVHHVAIHPRDPTCFSCRSTGT